MIAKSPDFEEAHVAEVFGIPLRWFQQISMHCDAYFIRKGMPKEPTFRENISNRLEIAVRRARTLRLEVACRSREAGEAVSVEAAVRRKAFRDSRLSQVTTASPARTHLSLSK
jgi:hypothetical protein